MIVIATGPRSNGTSLLYRILCTGDTFPLHIPAYPPWFRGRDWAQDFPTALFVVIYRDMHPASSSLLARGLVDTFDAAMAEQYEARGYLSRFLASAGPRARVTGYEELVDDPHAEVEMIDRFLRRGGYDGPALTLPEPVYDANAKWQEKAA